MRGRWLLLLLTAALLIGLTATVAWAGTNEPLYPDWLEPRGMSIVDLVGELPESTLKGSMISAGDSSGIVVYESGQRTGDTVVITTKIYTRYWKADWAPNGMLTMFGCLGQIPVYDHLASVVPASTLRIYDAGGTDVTSKIGYMFINNMGLLQPPVGSRSYNRFPETQYGGGAQYLPLPMGPDGLNIPANSGCRIHIVGEDLYPLTGVFTLNLPRSIRASVVGAEEIEFHSMIGTGNVGVFGPVMSQMKARYGERHDKFDLTVPEDTEFLLVKVPPMPGDMYADVTQGRPYCNANRPSGGTYRLSEDVNRLGSDMTYVPAFPMEASWRDSDQSPGREFLPELITPTLIATPEYPLPASIPYHPCYTEGNCPASVLEDMYRATMLMEITYFQVRRLPEAVGQWVPVRMAGPAYRPTAQSISRTQPNRPQDLTAISSAIQAGSPVTITKSVAPESSVPYHSLVTYTITLSNPGRVDASGVILTDALPTSTLFDSWIENQVGTDWVDNKTLSWSGTVISSTSLTFSFLVSQTAGYGQEVVNTAELTHAATYASAAATFTVEPPPVLVVAKTATPGEDVVYHSPVTYTIILRNLGPSPAASVTLTDALPPEVRFSRWVGDNLGATETDDEIKWTGDLTSTQAVTLTFVVSQTAGYGQTVTNTAWISHVTGIKNTQETFTVEPSPFLDIDKIVEPKTDVGIGNPITYTITMSNKGTVDAERVVMTDTLNALTSFAAWLGPSYGAIVSGSQITWTGTLTASQAVTFTFLANQSAGFGQTVANSAEFSHHTGKGEATAEFTILTLPSLGISKTVTPTRQVGINQPVVYAIVVKNDSSQDALGVLVSDTLSSETSFVSWEHQPPGAIATSRQVTWTGTVTSGQAITLAFAASQTAQPLATVTNEAAYHHVTNQDTAVATFTVGIKNLWEVYLPLILGGAGGDQPEPPEPPEPLPDGCPCGWFDGLGRMLDFELGDDY